MRQRVPLNTTHSQHTLTQLQLWKTHRIGGGEHESEGGFKLANLYSRDAFTAAGVELSAGLGALCFLFGTLVSGGCTLPACCAAARASRAG